MGSYDLLMYKIYSLCCYVELLIHCLFYQVMLQVAKNLFTQLGKCMLLAFTHHDLFSQCMNKASASTSITRSLVVTERNHIGDLCDHNDNLFTHSSCGLSVKHQHDVDTSATCSSFLVDHQVSPQRVTRSMTASGMSPPPGSIIMMYQSKGARTGSKSPRKQTNTSSTTPHGRRSRSTSPKKAEKKTSIIDEPPAKRPFSARRTRSCCGRDVSRPSREAKKPSEESMSVDSDSESNLVEMKSVHDLTPLGVTSIDTVDSEVMNTAFIQQASDPCCSTTSQDKQCTLDQYKRVYSCVDDSKLPLSRVSSSIIDVRWLETLMDMPPERLPRQCPSQNPHCLLLGNFKHYVERYHVDFPILHAAFCSEFIRFILIIGFECVLNLG